MNCFRACILISCMAANVLSYSSRTEARQLSIAPVPQETPVWCWLASMEMTLKHYNVPNLSQGGSYQCGLVATLGGRCATDCRQCVFPGGSMQNISVVMNNYPAIAARILGRLTTQVRSTNLPHYFNAGTNYNLFVNDFIYDNIDNGHPIIAGISPGSAPGSGFRYPPGLSEHVAVIIGIEGRGPQAILTVNDPYPYRPNEDPYLRVGARKNMGGQYAISVQSFAVNLNWTNSIFMRSGPIR